MQYNDVFGFIKCNELPVVKKTKSVALLIKVLLVCTFLNFLIICKNDWKKSNLKNRFNGTPCTKFFFVQQTDLAAYT